MDFDVFFGGFGCALFLPFHSICKSQSNCRNMKTKIAVTEAETFSNVKDELLAS